jgi:excinuclease ABC subunit C
MEEPRDHSTENPSDLPSHVNPDPAGTGPQPGTGALPSLLSKSKPDLQPKLRELPHKPGVYVMRDRFSRVIYVGKAKDLKRRVSQYFMPSRRMTADPKTRALLEAIWDLEWHTVRTEPEALLMEGKLIKDFRPRYNISFRDDKRFLLVKVDPREEWPRFRLTRVRSDDGCQYFGPFAHSGALRQTLAFLRKKFGVLTFGTGSPTEKELKSSVYQVPQKLSALTGDQYRERVGQAADFLDGKSKELLGELETEMHRAAEVLNFERAAELRNMLEDLRKTTAPVRRFTRLSLPTAVQPANDMAGLQEALSLHRLPVHMECFDISNISSTHIVASMVCFRDGLPDRASYRRYRITTTGGQNDFASMAEVVRRRYARVLQEGAARVREDASGDGALVDYSETQEPQEEAARRGRVRLPDLIVVDGGKGQLSAARKELARLGLHGVPIVGLAKEFEEIHVPDRSEPIVLSHENGALRLLQRIRDEAHRFANGYHQLLLKRRVSESVLDDCPGVSSLRKQQLLSHFGSVARLRRASVDEIAALEGVSPRLARQIAEFLAPNK